MTQKLLQVVMQSLKISFSFLIPALCHAAQPLIDSGRLLEGIKPPPEIGPPRASPPINVVPVEPTVVPSGSDVTVLIKGFRITGNTVYSEDVLIALLRDNVGRQLNLSQLQSATEIVTSYYRRNGYLLARAFLPPQELREGIVTIEISEGRIGEIRLNMQGPIRISQSVIGSFLANIRPGDVLRQAELERSLQLLNDLPQLHARVTLAPGHLAGTSDLIVEVSQDKLITREVDLDNYGTRFTGRERAGLTVNFNDPTGRGDRIALRATTTGKGLSYGSAVYDVPISGRGTRLGAAYSYLKYELQEEFESLDSTGEAHVYSLYATHPFIKRQVSALIGQLKLERKELKDRIEAVGSHSDKSVLLLSAGADFYNRDDIGGGGINTLTLTLELGRLDINTAELRAIDEAGLKTNGTFGKVNISLTRVQYLTPSLSLYLAFSAQGASRNLDSSEKFSLAGPYGVRAYAEGEVSGDDGYLATVEARWLVLNVASNALTLSGFLDAGTVRFNHNKLPIDLDNDRTLAGAGIGLTWIGSDRYLLRAAYARKLKARDRDAGADGRFMVQAVKSF